MTIIGSLETFSLPELFRLIDSGSKTAELIIQPSQEYRPFAAINDYPVSTYHLWFYQGQLVTITSNRPQHLNLISIIEQQGWTDNSLLNYYARTCPPNTPVGVYLSKMKVFPREKLKSLFQVQLHQIHQLFNLSSGKFQLKVITEQHLQPSSIMPWLEMTGLSISAVKVNILALRVLKNWDIFAEKLPESSSALQQLVYQPTLRLNYIEQQLWEMAFGTMSLGELTQIHNLSLLEVQKAAFRLMMGRLVEEIPLAIFRKNTASVSSNAMIMTYNTPQPLEQLSIPVASTNLVTTSASPVTYETKLAMSDTVLPNQQQEIMVTENKKFNSLLKRLINFLRSKL